MLTTPLDLTCEFALLDDAKTRCGGTLPLASEKRWADLKAFYDMLMAQNGIQRRATIQSLTVSEIRQKLPVRTRLRVPAEMDIFVEHQSEYHTARLVNLSCGGALLSAEPLFDRGSRLTLYLIKLGRGGKPYLKTQGEVVWMTRTELAERMGIRFVELSKPELEELEAFVIETLERKLLEFDVGALAPDLARRRLLL